MSKTASSANSSSKTSSTTAKKTTTITKTAAKPSNTTLKTIKETNTSVTLKNKTSNSATSKYSTKNTVSSYKISSAIKTTPKISTIKTNTNSSSNKTSLAKSSSTSIKKITITNSALSSKVKTTTTSKSTSTSVKSLSTSDYEAILAQKNISISKKSTNTSSTNNSTSNKSTNKNVSSSSNKKNSANKTTSFLGLTVNTSSIVSKQITSSKTNQTSKIVSKLSGDDKKVYNLNSPKTQKLKTSDYKNILVQKNINITDSGTGVKFTSLTKKTNTTQNIEKNNTAQKGNKTQSPNNSSTSNNTNIKKQEEEKGFLSNLISGASNLISKAANTVKNTATKVVNTVTNTVTKAANTVKNAATKVVNTATSAIKTTMNTVKNNIITTFGLSRSELNSKAGKSDTKSVRTGNSEVDYVLESARVALEQQRDEIIADKNSKNMLGEAWDNITSLFGGGSTGELNQLADLEELYEIASKNPTEANLNALYQALYGTDVNLNASKESLEITTALNNGITLANGEVFTMNDLGEMLLSQANGLDTSFDESVSSQGILSKGIGWFNNNILGVGTTERMAEAQIKEYIELATAFNNTKDPIKQAALFKELTGTELNQDSLNKLLNGQSMVENSKASESIMDYEQTQDTIKTTAIAVGTSAAIIATGGVASIGIAGSVVLSAGINVGANIIDTVTQNNGETVGQNFINYVKNDLVIDASVGAINGLTSIAGNYVGGKVTNGIVNRITSGITSNTGKTLANLAGSTIGNFVDGALDGGISSGAEYIITQTYNGDDINLKTLSEITKMGIVSGGTLNTGISLAGDVMGKIVTKSLSDAAAPKADVQLNSLADAAAPKADVQLNSLADAAAPKADVQLNSLADAATPKADVQLNSLADAAAPKADVQAKSLADAATPKADVPQNIKTDTSTSEINTKKPRKSENVTRTNNLDKYKVNKNKTYLTEQEFFDKIDYLENDGDYVVGPWSISTVGRKNDHCAWKMHIFSDQMDDFQDLFEVVSPYLNDNGINHKIIGSGNNINTLNASSQKGKAFTIYPSSVAEMEQIAVDLDYIIRQNGLTISDSNILGDNMLGDSGRLFYRYELKSGKFSDFQCKLSGEISPEMITKYDIDTRFIGNDMQKIYEIKLYEPNRGNNNYLASDMTIEDDIWRNFDPSKAKPTESLYPKTEFLETNYIDNETPKGEIQTKQTVDTTLAKTTKIQTPIDQSNSFNSKHNIAADQKILDGYRDGGRAFSFDSNGQRLLNGEIAPNNIGREIIVVDRTKDATLQSYITEVKAATEGMTDSQKADYIHEYVYDLSTKGKNFGDSVYVNNSNNLPVGQEILLGEIFKENAAVCRHRSLMYKVLGDEVGLNVELQRGNFSNPLTGANGGHAWNIVTLPDGTSYIYDVMHNSKTSITPGDIDTKASYYLTVDNKSLYTTDGVAILDYTNVNQGTKLPSNKEIKINGNETFNLSQNSSIDLSSPEIQRKLKAMNEGDVLTIGRNGDIKINDNSVSRQHLQIKKVGDSYHLIDVSTYGTYIGVKNPKIDVDVPSKGNISAQKAEAQVKADVQLKSLSDAAAPKTDVQAKSLADVAAPKTDVSQNITKDNSTSEINTKQPRKSENVSRSKDLDKYKVSKDKVYLSEKDFLEKNNYTQKGRYVVGNWSTSLYGSTKNHIPWKMHIFSDNIKDFQDLFEVISPYLNDNNINHKMIGEYNNFDKLNSSSQRGKAFTIYPSSIAEMEQIAVDLDYIIKNNGLEKTGSNIVGDNNLGTSGRLFYRYEFKSGKYSDMQIDLAKKITPEIAERYGINPNFGGGNMDKIYKYVLYDSNRGEGHYLASDMSLEDDIWRDFDPSAAKPAELLDIKPIPDNKAKVDYSLESKGSKLNESYLLNKTDLNQYSNYLKYGLATTSGVIIAGAVGFGNNNNNGDIIDNKENLNQKDTEPSTSNVNQTPSSNVPQTPSSIAPQKPSSIAPQKPSSNAPQTPSSNAPQTPSSNKPQTPSSNAPQTPSSNKPQTPYTGQPTIIIPGSTNTNKPEITTDITNPNIFEKIDFNKDIDYNSLLSNTNLIFNQDILYTTPINNNLKEALYNTDKNISVIEEEPFIFHTSKNNDFSSIQIDNELMLNVIGSAELIKELDKLMTTGQYTIAINGKNLTIDLSELTNFKFSVIKDTDKWNYCEYPITLYFDGEVNEETYTAIEAIVMKYVRGNGNNKIMGNESFQNPWIRTVKKPSNEDLAKLLDKVTEINDNFMNTLLVQCGNYTGLNYSQYLRTLNIIQQNEEYILDLI